MMKGGLLLGLCLSAAPAFAAQGTLDLAWLRDGAVSAVQLRQDGRAAAPAVDGATMVPLGSLWKLFVYLYAADTGAALPDYHCSGRAPEEVYCCEPGQSIDRDTALAQSCGLLFEPARAAFERGAWRRYWSALLGAPLSGELAWLAEPAALEPGASASLGALLRVLGRVPPAARAEAETALLRVVLDGRGADSVRWLGGRLRAKTFTWHQSGRPHQRLGGAAGWLADGTPVWFGADDTSSAVFRTWAPQLAASLPQATAADGGCVVVDFFTRYPLNRLDGPDGPAAPGPLLGRHVARFENGQRLAFLGSREMSMLRDATGRIRIQGRFSVNDYVARVLDREADATQQEAARALAIAARTYLQQNARGVASCLHIADSSATQRVSASPPSAPALAAARWTDRLVIEGAQVRYHRDLPGPDVLAWTQAVELGRAGRPFDAILAQAYPRGVLSVMGAGGQRCRRLHANEEWLARMLPRWERLLLAQPGYERPAQPPAVCALGAGAPYSEQSRNRVFMRPIATREDRITLAHEYLHLGLRRHPRGQDEDYVEQLARRLADLTPGSP